MTVFNIFAAAEDLQGVDALGIDLLAILAQAVTFLFVFFIIKQFALGKIVAALEKRRKTIEDGIRLGIEMEGERAKLEETISNAMNNARVEADKVIALAHRESGDILKEAQDAATRKSEALMADAQARIEDEVKKAKMQLEKEVLHLIAEATEVIIGEKLDEQKDEQLIRRALSEVRR